jgi:hypothetical protein
MGQKRTKQPRFTMRRNAALAAVWGWHAARRAVRFVAGRADGDVAVKKKNDDGFWVDTS